MVSRPPTLTLRFLSTLALLSRVRLLICVQQVSWLKGVYRLPRARNRLLAFGRVSLADCQPG